MSDVAKYGARYDYGVRRAARGVPRGKIVDRLSQARNEWLTVSQIAAFTNKHKDEVRRYLVEMVEEGLAVRTWLQDTGDRPAFGYKLATKEEQRVRQSED